MAKKKETKGKSSLFTSENQPKGAPLTRFSSDNQPAKVGRRKSIYTVLKDKGYSKDDIRTVFEEIFWYTEQEANDIVKDPDVPIIAKITAKTMLQALKYGQMDRIATMLEYVLGKPESNMNLKVEQQKKLKEYMDKTQDIDYEEISDKIGAPVDSEDGFKSIIQEFKKKMEGLK